jgi:hypothetical protein
MKMEFVGGLLACVEADVVRKHTDEPLELSNDSAEAEAPEYRSKKDRTLLSGRVPRKTTPEAGRYGLPGDVRDELLSFKVVASLRSKGCAKI